MIASRALRKETGEAEKCAAVISCVESASSLKPTTARSDGGESGWWDRACLGVGEDRYTESELATCEECGDTMRPSRLRLHVQESCPFRVVFCSNRQLGCHDEIPLALLQLHLQRECEVEKKKDLMIERSENKEMFICPGCGDEVPMARYRRHQQELCVDRKLPCKNHGVGCRVMVRKRNREQHEFVDGRVARIRSCLYLGGQGTHILLVRLYCICYM